MRGFLAVSVAPHAADRLRRPAEAVLSCLTDDDTTVTRVDETGDGWVAFAGSDGHDILGPSGEGFTVRLSRLLRTRDDELSTADIPAMLTAGTPLVSLLPPFAAAHRERAGAPVSVANDWLGYRQLFWWRGDGAAAVSTSARGLAVLAGAGFDRAGLGAQAMHKVATDENDRIDVGSLRAAVAADRAAGMHPFGVAASAGTVGTGAIDPLGEIADLCPRLIRIWI